MERRPFGKTDMQVSVLGFGGAEIGFEKASPDTVARLLDDALDAGLNVIDTAECYLDSEELIGQAVSRRRNDFHLFTKCGHPESPGVEDWRPESLLSSIERSLKRLQTDRVDLVQLHSCSEAELRKGDVIAALQQARDKGYTRYIGYSGDGAAARFAVECGAFDSLQTSISIADQEAIDLTLPLAARAADGRDRQAPDRQRRLALRREAREQLPPPYWDRLQKLHYDFLQADPAQAAAIALRFTLNAPGRAHGDRRHHEAGPMARERRHARGRAAAPGPVRGDPLALEGVADATWVGQI